MSTESIPAPSSSRADPRWRLLLLPALLFALPPAKVLIPTPRSPTGPDVASVTVPVEGLAFPPVTVGNGPLLFFVHPEDELGRPDSGGKRTEVLYIHDPVAGTTTTALWRGRPPAPKPVERIDSQWILMQWNDRTFLHHLKTGGLRPLLPEGPTKVLSTKGSRIYFLDGMGLGRGLRLKTGEDGKARIEGYTRHMDAIWTMDALSSSPAVPLANVAVDRLVEIREDGFWAVTASPDRKLLRISRTGDVREILPFDPHWVTPQTKLEFSPDGKYLALSITHDDHDFHRERELVVVNLRDGRIVMEEARVRILSIVDSATPFLPLRWLDDGRLLVFKADGFWVADLAVRTFAKVDTSTIPPFPEVPKRKPLGHFDVEFGQVFYKGDQSPAASVLDERGTKVSDMEISPRGDWAALSSPKDSNVYLVDGKARRKSLLMEGWAYNIAWLPAAGDPPQKDR